jgi:hypothetical protein
MRTNTRGSAASPNRKVIQSAFASPFFDATLAIMVTDLIPRTQFTSTMVDLARKGKIFLIMIKEYHTSQKCGECKVGQLRNLSENGKLLWAVKREYLLFGRCVA